MMSAVLRAAVQRALLCVLAAVCCGLAAACGSPSAPTQTAPLVTSVTPNQGSTFGGTKITIAGARFAAGAAVTIGGVAATGVAMQAAGTITAVTAPHAAGPADVTVTVNGRSGTLPGGFTYVIEQVINAPPVIVSLAARGTRQNEPAQFADIDEPIAVTATVQDNETPVSALVFDWSADAGSFSGSGPTVTYTAPHVAGPVTLRLKITERYTAPDPSGLPIQRENTTFGTSVVDVHNSVKEVGDMAKDFLVLFSQSSVPADQVVHNFLDGCGAGGTGRRDELNQTIDNRKNFTITAWKVGEPRVAINFAGRCTFRSRSADACTAVDVDWSSTCKVQDPTAGCSAVGATRHDVGIDWVTAIYQAPTKRWWLCDSDFDTLFSSSLKPFRK